MTGMNVLVVGSGAREHAIAWKLASGPHRPDILAAPGNAGTASVGTNHDVDAEDIDGLARLALGESVDMTIVGPEAPLDAGIVDRFEERGLKAFGPLPGGGAHRVQQVVRQTSHGRLRRTDGQSRCILESR